MRHPVDRRRGELRWQCRRRLVVWSRQGAIPYRRTWRRHDEWPEVAAGLVLSRRSVRLRRLAIGVSSLGLLGASGAGALAWRPAIAPITPPPRASFAAQLTKQGERSPAQAIAQSATSPRAVRRSLAATRCRPLLGPSTRPTSPWIQKRASAHGRKRRAHRMKPRRLPDGRSQPLRRLPSAPQLARRGGDAPCLRRRACRQLDSSSTNYNQPRARGLDADVTLQLFAPRGQCSGWDRRGTNFTRRACPRGASRFGCRSHCELSRRH